METQYYLNNGESSLVCDIPEKNEEYLTRANLLSEFKTEEEKTIARRNLGITGNITELSEQVTRNSENITELQNNLEECATKENITTAEKELILRMLGKSPNLNITLDPFVAYYEASSFTEALEYLDEIRCSSITENKPLGLVRIKLHNNETILAYNDIKYQVLLTGSVNEDYSEASAGCGHSFRHRTSGESWTNWNDYAALSDVRLQRQDVQELPYELNFGKYYNVSNALANDTIIYLGNHDTNAYSGVEKLIINCKTSDNPNYTIDSYDGITYYDSDFCLEANKLYEITIHTVGYYNYVTSKEIVGTSPRPSYEKINLISLITLLPETGGFIRLGDSVLRFDSAEYALGGVYWGKLQEREYLTSDNGGMEGPFATIENNIFTGLDGNYFSYSLGTTGTASGTLTQTTVQGGYAFVIPGWSNVYISAGPSIFTLILTVSTTDNSTLNIIVANEGGGYSKTIEVGPTATEYTIDYGYSGLESLEKILLTPEDESTTLQINVGVKTKISMN